MAKAVPPHQEHTILQSLLRTDDEGVSGHDFADPGGVGLPSLHHDSLHQITLRKNSYEHAVAKYRHRPDIARDHCLCHIQHSLTGVGAISFLVLDEITDMHTSPKHKFRANLRTVHKREYRTKTYRGED